jgi:ATP-dependent RNA helicase HrpB
MSLPPLPIDAVLPELLDALRRSPSAVLQAPTGAGKTTRVPPALLDAGLADSGQIIVLEPRRLAARAAARRMASERAGRVGGEVGYQVRFDRQAGPETRILVVTPGILLRMLQDDPFLEKVGIVVFDEFHERGLENDLALGMVRLIQQTVRPALKSVVMSATLDAAKVSSYLNGCPAIISEGRLHSVENRYEERAPGQPYPVAAARAVERLLKRTDGDVLVFLPGMQEIRQTARELEPIAAERDLLLMPLHGDLSPEQQDAALLPQGQRKVVLATNVAETSVTVVGITAVVDTGLARVLRFHAGLGLDRLEIEPISRASADQRTGRAGRERPGTCVRLWNQVSHASRPEQTEPEIRRVDLAGAVLQLLSLGEADVSAFPWLEPPPEGTIAQALALLRRLGALNDGGLTELGRTLARLPVHPRLGRMLVEGHRLGQPERVALAAALLAERDPFMRSAEAGAPARPKHYFTESDVLDRVEALEAFDERGQTEFPIGALHVGGARFVLRAREQLARLLRHELGARVPSLPAGEPAVFLPPPSVGEGRGGGVSAQASLQANPPHPNPPPPGGREQDRDSPRLSDNRDEPVLRAILAAFPDRVARRRNPGGQKGVMVGGRGVKLAPWSGVKESELFVCVDVDAGQSEALVRQASAVRRDWLPPAQVVTSIDVEFQPASGRISAKKRVRFLDLLLEESAASLPEGDELTRRLAEAAASNLDRVLPPPDSAAGSWLRRARWLREWMPELNLPAFDEPKLRELLPWLCAGKRSFEEVRNADWLGVLQGKLTHAQLQAVEREAPERIEVPSGSKIRLEYEQGRPPVLAVRIQELFGLADTPRLAGGRVKVLLHLLGPNYRPQQVTDDLASFWANTYPTVRKELRARYPKHAWPDDPMNAPAQRRPKR